MANEEQLAILKQGVTAWNEWKHKHPDIRVELDGVEIQGLDLHDAKFDNASLNHALLTNVNLKNEVS